MKIIYHISYWILITCFLTLYFGSSKGDYFQSLYFATYLLPVAIGTSYFFTYFLMPTYLLTRRYWSFGLYFIYTLIISLYLEMLVAVAAFIILANYQFENMNPLTVDTFTMGVMIYLIVFFTGFVHLLRKFFGQEATINDIKTRQQLNHKKVISLRVDRKLVPINIDQIAFIESLADYIKVHTSEQTYISKEKISKMEMELPDSFIRIHRSYLVNSTHIESFTRETLTVLNQELLISRTYKKSVLELLLKD